MSHRYSYFSWWWAHCRPKHVQKRNKHTENKLWTKLALFRRLYRDARSKKHKSRYLWSLISRFFSPRSYLRMGYNIFPHFLLTYTVFQINIFSHKMRVWFSLKPFSETCFIDRASLYNLLNKNNLVHIFFISINLYMFRTPMGPSSGGTTVFMWHLALVILYEWLSGLQGGHPAYQTVIRTE